MLLYINDVIPNHVIFCLPHKRGLLYSHQYRGVMCDFIEVKAKLFPLFSNNCSLIFNPNFWKELYHTKMGVLPIYGFFNLRQKLSLIQRLNELPHNDAEKHCNFLSWKNIHKLINIELNNHNYLFKNHFKSIKVKSSKDNCEALFKATAIDNKNKKLNGYLLWPNCD